MRKIFTCLAVVGLFHFSHAQSGQLDNSFGIDGIAVSSFDATQDSEAKTMAIQADGKILIAGDTSLGSVTKMSVTRMNTDGSVDTSFATNGFLNFSTSTSKSFINDIAVQSDGKIVLAGYEWNGISGNFALVRLNQNGSFDTTFGTNGIAILDSGMDEIGKSLHLLEDGKILIAGDISDQFGMTRVLSDGSIDTDFGTNGWARTSFSPWAFCYDVNVADNGDILLTGMTTQGSDWKYAIAHYNADGTPKTGFGTDGRLTISVGNGNDFGIRSFQTTDGQLLVAGHSYVGSTPLKYEVVVTRRNADGSLDTSYGTNGYARIKWLNNHENYLNDAYFDENENLFLCGRATDGDQDYYTLAKLNADGSLDTNFNGNGKVHGNTDLTLDEATAVQMQMDGKILIAGNTFDFENNIEIFAARFLNEMMAVQDFNTSNLKVYPNPTVEAIQINSNAKDFEYQIFNLSGQKLKSGKASSQEKIQVSEFAPGTYFIRINENGKSQTLRFIKK